MSRAGSFGGPFCTMDNLLLVLLLAAVAAGGVVDLLLMAAATTGAIGVFSSSSVLFDN